MITNVDKVIFQCPCCGSIFHMLKTAIRTETFLCPVCLDGEITCPETKPETGNKAESLLDGETWTILQPALESAHMS